MEVECAMNPIHQGGTWVYDRAGWCPGDVVDTKEYDINSQVSSGPGHQLDYSLGRLFPIPVHPTTE